MIAKILIFLCTLLLIIIYHSLIPLDTTLNSYINNTHSVIFTDTRMSDGLVDTAMQNDKRQDLDHVFLRFGRRRR